MSRTIPTEAVVTNWRNCPRAAPLPPVAAGWPVLSNVVALAGDVLGFLIDQYQKLGPIFRIRALNKRRTIIAGREANMFFAREGGKHFRQSINSRCAP